VPDAHCVMHVHTTPTMAVCCLDEGLSYTNFYAAQLWGQVAYHDFEGITVHADEGSRILASAGGQAGAAAAQPRPGGDRPDPGRTPVA
jgi:ribulose-5-phosphate 4-epimerase/fuculose-1-phosphate aldolase